MRRRSSVSEVVMKRRPVLELLAWAIACGSLPERAHAKLPDEAPPLPPPGAGYEIVEVDTAQELADACWNLESNRRS